MASTSTGKVKQGMFGRQITVNYGKKIKHKSAFLPDGHLSIIITGRAGAGKSFLLLNLIPNVEISQLVICSRVVRSPVYDALKKYCDDNDIEMALVTDPLTGEELIEDMLERRPDDTHTMVVLDDFSRNNQSRADPYTKFANDISKVMRNSQCYSIMIAQSSTDVNTIFRNNCTVRISFQMMDKYAIKSLKDSFLAGAFGSEQEFDWLYSLLERQHSFIMLVTDSPPRIYFHNGQIDAAPIEMKRVNGRLSKMPARMEKQKDNESSSSSEDENE